MKRWRVTAAILVACLFMPFSVLAVDESTELGVVITELQTTGIDENGDPILEDEFIELFNAGSEPVDLSGWSIQKSAAGSSNWDNITLTPELSGTLESGEHLLLSNFLVEADHTFSHSSRFAQSGGHIRIVSPDKNTADPNDWVEHDLIGWGTAQFPEGQQPAPSVEEGHSLKRKLDEDGNYIDTNENFNDFIDSDSPFPEASNPDEPEELEEEPEETPEEPTEEPEEEEEEPVPTDPGPESPEPEAPGPELLSPLITELMPNPASPATDAEDEYIELFNPNGEPFALKDFKLQTGSSFSYNVTFDSEVIPAQGYLLVYSKDTNLTLSNGGGDARLLDDEGAIIAEIDGYDDAEDGASWSLIGETWQWTSTPTPGLPNLLAALPAGTVKSKTTKTSAKKASAKKASTKAAKTSSTTERAIYEDPLEDEAITPVHPGILAGVGLAAVGYSLYEYRFDLQNRLERFRRYRAARRANGS